MRCPDCRDGLIAAEPWEAWYSRRDDAEAVSPGAFESSPEYAALLDERPDCDEEIECFTCDGTGRRVVQPRRHAA